MWPAHMIKVSRAACSRATLTRPIATPLLYRNYASEPTTQTPTTKTEKPTKTTTTTTTTTANNSNNNNNKYVISTHEGTNEKYKGMARLAAQVQALQADLEARQGKWDIETPKLYPPPQGGVSGSRRRKRLMVRQWQRRQDHKRYLHQRPTFTASKVNPRHLSLPPQEAKSRYPSVAIPRLRQIDYEKVEAAKLKKV